MNAAAFAIAQALQRYAADCRAAMHRMAQVTTLRELRCAADVRPAAIVAAVCRTVPEHRMLEAAGERRAEEICQGHLARLQELLDRDETEGFQRALASYRQNDWQLLRGDYPRLVNYVHRASSRLETTMDRPGPERPRA